MAIMLDYIASALIFGVLAFSIARIQININASMYQNTHNVITQSNAVELARQIEYDFLKMGFKVPTASQKIFVADTNKITFKSSLLNNGVIDSVQYSAGSTSEASFSSNAYDFPLKRKIGSETELVQQYGITRFKLTYFDVNNNVIATPIASVSQFAAVRSIKVFFRVESYDPVYTPYDTTWAGVSWEKLIFPRNLNNLYY